MLTKNRMLGQFCAFNVGQYYAYGSCAELTNIVLEMMFWLK
jgi:hypothetical protein